MKFILASESPRRREILKLLTDDFVTMTSKFDESIVPFKNDEAEYVIEISRGKVFSAAKKLNDSKMNEKDSIIIGCDTVVSLNGTVFGKPKDQNDAFGILKTLSGNIHNVYSGITLMDLKKGNITSDYEVTKVKFRSLCDEEIINYIKTGEPMDKAGAYAIQGMGSIFVQRIDGCFFNVMGLPIYKLNFMLRGMGVNLLEERANGVKNQGFTRQ